MHCLSFCSLLTTCLYKSIFSLLTSGLLFSSLLAIFSPALHQSSFSSPLLCSSLLSRSLLLCSVLLSRHLFSSPLVSRRLFSYPFFKSLLQCSPPPPCTPVVFSSPLLSSALMSFPDLPLSPLLPTYFSSFLNNWEVVGVAAILRLPATFKYRLERTLNALFTSCYSLVKEFHDNRGHRWGAGVQ